MIGVIDSGMGGLSTLAALIESGADNAFAYYADVGHAPYGNKPRLEVMALVREGCERLAEKGATKLVLACNTASTAALRYLRKTTDWAVFGVLPPVERALALGGKSLLLGTTLTTSRYRDTDGFRALPLPELATLVDRDYPDVDAIGTYCRERLDGVGEVDNLILGCTHYVLVKDVLSRIIKPRNLLDGNEELLSAIGAPTPRATGRSAKKGVSVDVLSSGKIDRERYARTLERLVHGN